VHHDPLASEEQQNPRPTTVVFFIITFFFFFFSLSLEMCTVIGLALATFFCRRRPQEVHDLCFSFSVGESKTVKSNAWQLSEDDEEEEEESGPHRK
jgi:hypothetical protein